MKTEDLYPLWIEQGRKKIAQDVAKMQRGYDRLVHKESTYGRTVKAMLDLRIKMLEVWDAAPRQLEPKPQRSTQNDLHTNI